VLFSLGSVGLFVKHYSPPWDDRRITAAEMKYMRRTAGYTWTDYRTNTQIAKRLKFWPNY
jgi:hypothetical protein